MSRPSPGQHDRGSATVVMTAVVAVVLVLLVALLSAAAGRVAVVRAQGAADAGAVAAAAALVGRVPGAPCPRARAVVDASGASLTACDTAGGLARVVVVVRSGPFTVDAHAVAGPRRDAVSLNGDRRPAGIPDTVCMVCLSARRSSMSRSTRTRPRPRADSTIDQGVTCQARRSS